MSDNALQKRRRWTETAREVPFAKKLARQSGPQACAHEDTEVRDTDTVDSTAESGMRAKVLEVEATKVG